MTQSPSFRRNTLRLRDYDYSQPGLYFITICTKDRQCRLGRVDDCTVKLSPIGSIARSCWMALPDWFPNVDLDDFVIMPNHLHGIIQINEVAHALSNIIGSFKSATTRISRQNQLSPNQQIWQRGYFDHIIRTEKSLFCLRQYILDNPIQWHLDELNPANRFATTTHDLVPTLE
jgi:REP element-mobilizing transposase RayT